MIAVQVPSVVLMPDAPSLYKDRPFTSACLLPASLDTSLLLDPHFSVAAAAGYASYFEEMYERAPGGTSVFVDTFHSWYHVLQFIVDCLVEPSSSEKTPLAWSAGFLLGWLSALALTDRVLALRGVALLSQLIFCLIA